MRISRRDGASHLNAYLAKKCELPQHRQPGVLGRLLQTARKLCAHWPARIIAYGGQTRFIPRSTSRKSAVKTGRVGDHYRAIGKFVEGGFLWEWFGTHGEYDRLA